MDWEYIFSLQSEDLTENTKNELFNTIAWYECESDDMDLNKSVALLKLSQEIMKFKSEQVEALLAELDEIAMKQGEEEAKKLDSDLDVKSVKSKKSGSIDIDDLDNKYRDLKMKFKKMQKAMDKCNVENEKLKRNAKVLEQEREHLQYELERSHRDESGSDISEAVKDQQKDLIDNLHLKNQHISQLLTDIESIESENLTLRKKLTDAKDELSDTTDNLKTITSEMTVYQVKLEELKDMVDSLKIENSSLKTQIVDIVEDKKVRESEFEEFAIEIDKRVDEWKRILDAKNKDIDRLNAKLLEIPATRSSSNSSVHNDDTQINILQRAISEREAQIIELQGKLQTAVTEMEDGTVGLELLLEERDKLVNKVEKSSALYKEIRKQLKNAHNRSQNLQMEVKYLESMVELKENELKDLVNKIDDLDLQQCVSQVHELEETILKKEKQVEDLVRTCNKLQSAMDNSVQENLALRKRLGLSEDDFVGTKSVNAQQRKQKKVLSSLTQEVRQMEEEKLDFRLEIQKLSKVIANLSDQIIDLGETPNIDHERKMEENQDVSRMNAKQNEEGVTKEEYTAMVDENNALRKGLHEILDCVHAKEESSKKEIKSDTLESLLRALDVKHISGWYHPAMRLQAELHPVQGSNNELREQLRLAREELENSKFNIPIVEASLLISSENNEDSSAVIANLNMHIANLLKNYKLEEESNTNLIKKLEHYKHEFTVIQEQICILYAQYKDEKENWQNSLSKSEHDKAEFEGKVAVLEAKINTIELFTDAKTDDDMKAVKAAEMSEKLVVMNRKCVYLENQEAEYKREILSLRSDVLNCETSAITKINKLKKEKESLLIKLKMREVENCNIKSQDFIKLQNNYDNLLIKERQIMHTVDEIYKINDNEVMVLKKQVELVNKEKEELQTILQETIKDKYADENIDLAEKLAKIEMSEIKEGQRANHANNLYELVKDQLRKCEDRYKEYQKFNNEIMHKNLTLQETIRELEDNILNSIDHDIYKNLENNYLTLLKTHEALMAEKSNLETELLVSKKESKAKQLWTNLEQNELLNLKHQIVDLQSAGDDKTVIARLSSDVVIARLAETDTRKKLDIALEEITKCKSDVENLEISIQNDKEKFYTWQKAMENMNSHLELVIRKQRQHFVGYIPFTSEYKFLSNIHELYKTKKNAYENLQEAQKLQSDCEFLKDELNLKSEILEQLDVLMKNDNDQSRSIEKWYQDRTNLQLQELRYRRQAEFREKQLKEANAKLNSQAEIIEQLECELLESLIIKDEISGKANKELQITLPNIVEIKPIVTIETKNKETQTIKEAPMAPPSVNPVISNLESELSKRNNEISSTNEVIQQQKIKIAELELGIGLLKQQIGDKQNQLSFYEKHILEMQNKKQAKETNGDMQEIVELNEQIKHLQVVVSEKEDAILKYQSLLKLDRDEHSLAASRFQEELKELQSKLMYHEIKQQSQTEQPQPQPLEHPGRAAIEQYILKVHALEKHTRELHTSVTTLNSQLQASREEAVRWRSLASDRLQSIEELRLELEEQHRNEIQTYKDDSDRWKSEVRNLQEFVNKYKSELTSLRPDIEKEFKEKDNKIHELTVTIRQLKNDIKKKSAPNQPAINRAENFKEVKETLLREHEVLKRRFSNLMSRERTAREEIRTLKSQLMKRPLLSARSDSSSTTKEQNLQKKISAQETEIQELKDKLERELFLNEAHKVKVQEDFEKWNKQKLWQQTADKLKSKLKEKTEEFDKLQQTCCGYRILIERLEREKHNLEHRIKNLKVHSTNVNIAHQDVLEMEYGKLRAENNELRQRLEMQQLHSGGLGAAMLQEKLEAQERKLAVMEMSSKGSGELRAEFERLQNLSCTLQKSNLRLEAENLELRLDLEKSRKDMPHLREQISHLENYIQVLKSEKSDHEVSCSGDHVVQLPETKRVSELERTVFVLKRIVEKLQVENKRLLGGGASSKPYTERTNSADKIRREYNRLKDQHTESVQKIDSLESELKIIKSKRGPEPEDAAGELEDARAQLKQKAELLDKVKGLLQRAAAKEKALLEQVSSLKSMIVCDCKKTE